MLTASASVPCCSKIAKNRVCVVVLLAGHDVHLVHIVACLRCRCSLYLYENEKPEPVVASIVRREPAERREKCTEGVQHVIVKIVS